MLLGLRTWVSLKSKGTHFPGFCASAAWETCEAAFALLNNTLQDLQN